MSGEPYAALSKAQLFARLAEGLAGGVTVITPNQRLAQSLEREFDAAQAAQGRSAWESADILSYSAFVQRCYEDALYSELASALPILLTPAQEQSLWEDAIRASKLAETLLSASSAATQCREAWQLAHAGCLMPRLKAAAANEDAKAFLDWAARYERACARSSRKSGYIDAARLPDAVIPLLAHQALTKPKTLVRYGFDIMTAQQRALLDALEAVGIEVLATGPAGDAGRCSRIAFTAERDEMLASATWARARLEANPQAHIGVVVPGLAQARSTVKRIFASIMQPDHSLPGVSKQTLPFNISIGISLNQYPLVHDALLALQLAGREIEFNRASRLLRSPFFAGSEAEMTARARLDAVLRARAGTTLTLEALLRLMDMRGAPRCPVLAERLSQLAEFRKTNLFGAKRPSEWAKAISAALGLLGFLDKGRGLDSTEYQTLKKWHEVVAGFAALDAVAGRMGYADACRRLARVTADTLFQPEAADVPVQILGVLESAGLEFDHLWVMGLTDDAWPIPVRPNPFIPIKLQREAGVPQADAAGSIELDRRITAGWLAAAPEVVFSHPLREGDRELSASPLIAAVPGAMFEDFGIPVYDKLRDAIHRARREERIADDKAPELARLGADAGPHSGGTGIFRDQAACPFRAFAAHRLGTEALETPQPGLNARDRGTLLHSVLAAVWTALGGKAALDAISTDDLATLLAHCADEAIGRLRRWKPEALQGRFAERERSRLAALARDWLEFEKQRPVFEVAAVEEKRVVQFGGVAVNAKLDRMDKLGAGGHVILDYKTGEASVTAWLGTRPDEPQLPLYAIGSEKNIAAVAFARVKTGELEFKGIARDKDLLPGVKTIGDQRSALAKGYGSWENLVEGWRRELAALGQGFASGDARVAPKHGDDTCQFCGMQPLCRINERSDE
ncbi:MAG: PD-(D/E)XK nuclease family protein [Betaproteobacteria bacterium]|nr:MAG: PD-(D/E)XK nuclease family protein [Betaproteobacteria bacterium]